MLLVVEHPLGMIHEVAKIRVQPPVLVAEFLCLAAELRRDDADDEVTVQGTVDEVTAGEALTLLGITVVVDGGTEYRDAADNPMGASDFFAAVSTGTSVKAKGVDLGGGVLGAEELELEPED